MTDGESNVENPLNQREVGRRAFYFVFARNEMTKQSPDRRLEAVPGDCFAPLAMTGGESNVENRINQREVGRRAASPSTPTIYFPSPARRGVGGEVIA